MTPLEVSLRQIVAELTQLQRSYALVGGLAVSARADPRLTRDADLAVSVVDDTDAENLIAKLGPRYQVLALVEQAATGRLATVRLVPRDEERPLVVDLLFASSGIEHEIAVDAEELEVFPGTVIRIARVGYLIAMKLLARDDRHRPADADDLASLRAIASPDDWQLAEEAVELITERGANRGRNLVSALVELRQEGPY